ncbi:MAG: hypothetical protein JWQ07_5566 [Ramlibacter sp.]|jgi:hypothetical protein|nr:hypothetical protein [Ramlibacter sp.]
MWARKALNARTPGWKIQPGVLHAIVLELLAARTGKHNPPDAFVSVPDV